MNNPRRFIFNSDFPIDHVIYIQEIEVPFSFVGVKITHNLNFTPLLLGIFSTDDWRSSMPIDTPVISGESTGSIQVKATSKDITLVNYFRSSEPAKVRLFGLAPSDKDVDVAIPSTRYSNFNFNTDFNYSKLVKSGVYEVKWNSGENILYEHNLGYIPEVEVWQENSEGEIKKFINTYDPNGVNYSSLGSRVVYIKITDEKIVIHTDGENQDIKKIHFRIYGDQNG